MNRKTRRNFVKKARKKGISKNTAEAYIAIKEAGLDKLSLPKRFNEGDMVRIDVEKIMSRKDYERLNPKYREFIESNRDSVFTAHLERDTLISFVEHPEWLFWSGILIKVEEENNGKDEEIESEAKGKENSRD